MKVSGRYTPGLYAGFTGILALILINAFNIPRDIEQARKRSFLKAKAELEQTKAKLTKETALSYAKNQVTTFDQLIIRDYTLSDDPPRIDWGRTVDPTTKTVIYDKNRLCIGYAHQGAFYFIKYYQGVCGQWH